MTVGGTNDLALLTTEFEPIARAVSAAYPTRKPVRVLPVLQVWNQMMSAGYTNLWLSATDGHANDNGKYILCTTLYTCLYKRNAAGAVTTGFTGVSAAFATKAQELAWSVAQSYPMSGVGTTAVIPNNTPATYRTAQQLLATDACAFDLTGRAVRGAQTSSGVPSARGVYFARTTSANGVSKVVKSGQPVNFK